MKFKRLLLLLSFHYTAKMPIIGRQTDDHTADLARDNFCTSGGPIEDSLSRSRCEKAIGVLLLLSPFKKNRFLRDFQNRDQLSESYVSLPSVTGKGEEDRSGMRAYWIPAWPPHAEEGLPGGWNVPLIPWKFNFFSLISSSHPHSAGWPKGRQRGSSILTSLLLPSWWCSNRSRWCQHRCSSSSTVLRHVAFGLRLFRFPSGVQWTAT